jgi:hypothetical protein
LDKEFLIRVIRVSPRLLFLRFLPELFQFLNRRLIERLRARVQRSFDVLEPASKLSVRQLQRRFWFDLHVPSDIRDGEQQVANLFPHARVIGFVLRV